MTRGSWFVVRCSLYEVNHVCLAIRQSMSCSTAEACQASLSVCTSGYMGDDSSYGGMSQVSSQGSGKKINVLPAERLRTLHV
jgi:hypothetical protein